MENTLRQKIEESKAWYIEHFGELNWQWVDEGLPNTTPSALFIMAVKETVSSLSNTAAVLAVHT